MNSGDESDSPYEDEGGAANDSENSAGGESHTRHRVRAPERVAMEEQSEVEEDEP